MPSKAWVLVWKAEAQRGLVEAERSWDDGRGAYDIRSGGSGRDNDSRLSPRRDVPHSKVPLSPVTLIPCENPTPVKIPPFYNKT